VTGASLRNGLLHIDLTREIPEAMKPRRIAIASDAGAEPKQIEATQGLIPVSPDGLGFMALRRLSAIFRILHD
jgi:hypothetical protein